MRSSRSRHIRRDVLLETPGMPLPLQGQQRSRPRMELRPPVWSPPESVSPSLFGLHGWIGSRQRYLLQGVLALGQPTRRGLDASRLSHPRAFAYAGRVSATWTNHSEHRLVAAMTGASTFLRLRSRFDCRLSDFDEATRPFDPTQLASSAPEANLRSPAPHARLPADPAHTIQAASERHPSRSLAPTAMQQWQPNLVQIEVAGSSQRTDDEFGLVSQEASGRGSSSRSQDRCQPPRAA